MALKRSTMQCSMSLSSRINLCYLLMTNDSYTVTFVEQNILTLWIPVKIDCLTNETHK